MSNQSVNIRQAFVPRPGYYWLDADYAQIEFKLSAAIAGETHLIDGFARGDDYYTMVYDSMYGTTYRTKKAIPASQRKLGKEIALGQNYGQEARGLARKLKVPLEKGQEYMDAYWNGMPATRRAKDAALEFALANGFIKTWFGRIRPLPDLFSTVRSIKAKGVRSVWNSECQGTAADVLKIAMVRTYQGLQGHDAHMILTVHDELLIEVSEKEPFHEITSIVKTAMEFPIKGLPVGMADKYPNGYSIATEPEYGYDWGSLMSAKAFLEKYGDRLNLTPTRPDAVFNFIAEPNKDPKVTIPERLHNVAGKEQLVNSNVHPLDELLTIIHQLKGDVKIPPTPVSAHLAEEVPIVAAPVISQDMKAKAGEALKDLGEMPPLAAPVVSVPPLPIDGIPVKVTMENTKETDFCTPYLLVEVTKTLTPSEINFLKALFQKFPGQYWVYLSYQGKVLKLGDSMKCDPNPSFLGYLKKGLGLITPINVFDEVGKPARGRVEFT